MRVIVSLIAYQDFSKKLKKPGRASMRRGKNMRQVNSTITVKFRNESPVDMIHGSGQSIAAIKPRGVRRSRDQHVKFAA